MSSDSVIRLHEISKDYLIYDKPEARLKQMIFPRVRSLLGLAPVRYYREFPAVSNVSFEVGKGETVGIIGRNGSGKSTTLEMICGTLQPSHGSIEVNGRIAALLELGSGFNPDFTGRENVYLNAAILGLSREEIDSRFEAIADFAGIGEFMEQPVKTYSSGMYVRLAFSVATNVDPDILVVDEALAVGDEAFQRKCFARIEQIKDRGGTILFVSHSPQSIIQLCDRAILLDGGEKIMEGSPKIVVSHYQRLLNLSGEEAEAAREKIKSLDGWASIDRDAKDHAVPSRPPAHAEEIEDAWFDPSLVSSSSVEYDAEDVRISNVRIMDQQGQVVNNLVLNQPYRFVYDVDFSAHLVAANFAMFVKTIHGVEIAGQHAFPFNQGMQVEAGDKVEISLPFVCSFLPGTYSCNCGVFIRQKGTFKILHRILDVILFRVLQTDAHYSRHGLVDICPDNSPVDVRKIASNGSPSETAHSFPEGSALE